MRNKDLLRKNDAYRNRLGYLKPLAATLAASILLLLIPFAARAQFAVTGTITGNYSTLNAAINACSSAGSYTITVSGNATLAGSCEMHSGVNITLKSNNTTKRTITRTTAATLYVLPGASLTMQYIVLDGAKSTVANCPNPMLVVGLYPWEHHWYDNGGESQLIMDNCEVNNCKNITGDGAGIFIGRTQDHYTSSSTSEATINNCTFTGNETPMTGNYAANRGGAICVMTKGTLNLNTATFTNNTANYGAGIFNAGTLICAGNNTLTMSNNTALGGGGLSGFGETRFIDSYSINMTNNRAIQGPGGSSDSGMGGGMSVGLVIFDTYGSLYFADNEAETDGGGIRCSGSGVGSLFTDFNLSKCSSVTFLRNTAGREGGGIWATADIVLSENSNTFQYNQAATTTAGGGGAIYGMTITNRGNLLMENNQAGTNTIEGKGGAIYAHGDIDFYDGTIIKNTASYGGGAFYLNSGGVISGVTIGGSAANKNTSGGNGGGVYSFHDDALYIQDGSVISYNEAQNSGGGIYCEENSPLYINGATITLNKALNGDGGGVCAEAAANIYLEGGCQITNNTAYANGGGICEKRGWVFCQDNHSATITGNTAVNGNGGGIYQDGDYYVRITTTGTVTINDNHADNGNGGGIWTNRAGYLYNCNIGENGKANTAINGAGVYDNHAMYYNNQSYLYFQGGRCAYNVAQNEGGGLYINESNGEATFRDGCVIDHNTAGNGNGGGIYSNVNTILSNATVSNNTATGDGGGLYFPQTLKITLKDSPVFDRNTAGGSGGGIFSYGSIECKDEYSLTMTNNTATSGDGGGIYIDWQGSNRTVMLTLSNKETITFTNNKAGQDGGGIWVATYYTNSLYFAAATVTFSSNEAGRHGGAIRHRNDVEVLNSTCAFTNNKAGLNNSGAAGGAVYCSWFKCKYEGTLVMTGNEVGKNDPNVGEKYYQGGAIYCNNGLDLSGAGEKTISNNYSAKDGGGIFCFGAANINKCVFEDNIGANGEGGAIRCFGGTFTECTIGTNGHSNRAKYGGGVYTLSRTPLNVSESSIRYNVASQFGGGVYICENGELGVSGTVSVKDNTTTRSGSTYDLYLKKSKEDDVCLQTLNDDPATGNIGKIRLKGSIANSKIGITEEEVASGFHRSLDAEGNKKRQFTLDYGTYYSNKAAKDVFFSNDSILDIFLLTHPHPGTTTGLLEVTLGAEPIRSWYIAGIVDDNGLTWGDDANNSGLAPDVPLRTLTGPQGVFAKGYNPLNDHIFVVRAVSAQAEAAAGRLANGKVVVRYPSGATAATFLGNTTAIADEAGSEEVVLHRYPGGHRLVNGLADNGGATVAGQVAAGQQNGPGANTGPVFAMDNPTNQAKLYNIHMDGLREYSKEEGVTDADIDAIDPNHTHNPSHLRISPESALLSVGSGTSIALLEDCDLLLNDNKDGGDNSATLREKRTGGAVYCAGTLEMDTVTIVKNNCVTNGGGVFVTGSGSVTLLNSLVGGNGLTDKNTAANGGGIYIDGTGTVSLNEGCRVTYNTATNHGGGVYINANAAMNVNGSGTDGVLIKHNHADKVGGGVYKMGSLRVGGKVVITDNTSNGQ